MKAFTLAEMLLIMVLLSMAAALSLPNLGKVYNQLQLQNAVNHLTYTMRYAQSRAITQNKKVRLLFENSFKKYQLLEMPSHAVDQEYKSITGRWGKPIKLEKGISINSANASIDFLPTGEIEKADILLCHIKNCMIISTQQERGQVKTLDAS